MLIYQSYSSLSGFPQHKGIAMKKPIISIPASIIATIPAPSARYPHHCKVHIVPSYVGSPALILFFAEKSGVAHQPLQFIDSSP